MSVRTIANNGYSDTGIAQKTYTPFPGWKRNPSWSACSAPAGANKIVGLYAVYPGAGVAGANGSNFFAFIASGAYTIDYGDGTITNYASGTQANYEFNYASPALTGTNAPCSFDDATDTVVRTNHGYTNNSTVQFFDIVSTTGITAGQTYYVINAQANNFQISLTPNGSAVVLTTNGGAFLLPYKIATVTITPQAANSLTSVNFNVKNTATASAYNTGWLEIQVGCSTINSILISASITGIVAVYTNSLQSVSLNELGAVSSFANLFTSSRQLYNVNISPSITSVTDMSLMFVNCSALTTVPLFNTAAVTNMSNMFNSCTALTTVPLFNTAAVTTMANMFINCPALTTVPLFNTAAVTNMSNMFNACLALTTVPLFNTAAVTNMSGMIGGCSALTTVPLFNTAAVTNMSIMFSQCRALTTVPLFNTAAVTDMSNMFNACSALTTVPLFNTAAVTNMSNMFISCSALTTVPLFNTAAVTNMSAMFRECRALTTLPALVVTGVTAATGFSNMLANCSSLMRIQAKNFRFTFTVASCNLSATALNEIYTNLPTVTGQTITVTGNYGVTTDNPAIATAKGWAVTG